MRLAVFNEFACRDVLAQLPSGVEADIAPTPWGTPEDKRSALEAKTLLSNAKLFFDPSEDAKLPAALSALSAKGFHVCDAAPITSTGYDYHDRVVLRHVAGAAEGTGAPVFAALLELERLRRAELKKILTVQAAWYKDFAEQAADLHGRAAKEAKAAKGGKKDGGKKGGEAPAKERGAKAAEKAAKAEKKAASGHADAQRAPSPKAAPAGVDAKKLKAVRKEGGKKAQDLAGMADMGALFQQAMLLEPAGDMALLEEALDAMNVTVDPEAEERKGGAGGVAKILLSAGDDRLSVIVHVPEMFTKKGDNVRGYEIAATEWLDSALSTLPGDGQGAEMVIRTPTLAKCVYRNDPDKGRFVIKAKDAISGASFAFLRAKSLVVEDASDDEDFVYGDDDMPGC